MITQTGGGCRATNYIGFIRRALKKAGMEQIPVVSVSTKGIEKNPGFKMTLPLVIKAVEALIYGDLFMRVVYRTRPYEAVPGSVNELHAKWEKKVIESIKAGGSLSRFNRNIKAIIKDFDAIPLDESIRNDFEKVKAIFLTEVNVKDAEFIIDTTGIITKKIKPNFRTLGKKYGAQMKSIAAAFGGFDQKTIGEIQRAGTYTFDLSGLAVTLDPEDYEIISEDMPGWLVSSDGPLTIALDVELTDELRAEGVARELVNRVQNLRKDCDFDVTDKISVNIYADGQDYDQIGKSLESYREYLASQTLALSVELGHLSEAGEGAVEVEWNETPIKISVRKL